MLRFETEPGFFVTADAYGDPARPPILLLHGGGQTRHSWGGRLLEPSAPDAKAGLTNQHICCSI